MDNTNRLTDQLPQTNLKIVQILSRFGLLASHQILLLTCNVSNALAESRKVVSILFPGVCDLVERHENIILGVKSSAGEILNLTTPLDVTAFRGRIDQFWSHVGRNLFHFFPQSTVVVRNNFFISLVGACSPGDMQTFDFEMPGIDVVKCSS